MPLRSASVTRPWPSARDHRAIALARARAHAELGRSELAEGYLAAARQELQGRGAGGVVAAEVDEVGARDEVDRKRLLSLYGLDYQDPSAFDVVISTDGKTPTQVSAEVIAAVKARNKR